MTLHKLGVTAALKTITNSYTVTEPEGEHSIFGGMDIYLWGEGVRYTFPDIMV